MSSPHCSPRPSLALVLVKPSALVSASCRPAGRAFQGVVLGSWAQLSSQTRGVLLCCARNHENTLIRDLSLTFKQQTPSPVPHQCCHPASHLAWRCLEEGEELSGSLIPALQGTGGVSAPSVWPVVIVIADFCTLLPLPPWLVWWPCHYQLSPAACQGPTGLSLASGSWITNKAHESPWASTDLISWCHFRDVCPAGDTDSSGASLNASN